MSPAPTSEAPPPRRGLRALVFAALVLGALTALWFSSGAARVIVYAALYPYGDEDQRAELLRILREDEGRPDAAWSARLAVKNDEETWWRIADAATRNGPYEVRGLESEVAEALGGSEELAALALLVAVQGAMRDPSIAAGLDRFLSEDGPFRLSAIECLANNGRRQEALAAVLSYLRAARPAGGDLRSLGETDLHTAQALRVLRLIGPPAAEAGPELERWNDSSDPAERREALAALWLFERSPEALAALRSGLADEPPSRDRGPALSRFWTARVLAEIGQGDEACRVEIERWLTRPGEVPTVRCLEALARLGPVARPSLPAVRALLDHREPAVAFAARRAIAALGRSDP